MGRRKRRKKKKKKKENRKAKKSLKKSLSVKEKEKKKSKKSLSVKKKKKNWTLTLKFSLALTWKVESAGTLKINIAKEAIRTYALRDLDLLERLRPRGRTEKMIDFFDQFRRWIERTDATEGCAKAVLLRLLSGETIASMDDLANIRVIAKQLIHQFGGLQRSYQIDAAGRRHSHKKRASHRVNMERIFSKEHANVGD
jgi:hypothetical protein